MPLLAFNLTTSPLVLAAGTPAVTLTASATVGSRGPAHNVTTNLSGLTGPNYAALEVQRAAGSVEFYWDGPALYSTATLLAQAEMVSGSDFFIYVDPAGSDTNPGTLAAPVRHMDKALSLLPTAHNKRVRIILTPGGTYDWTTRTNFMLRPSGGPATPVIIDGGFTTIASGIVTGNSNSGRDVHATGFTGIRSGSAGTFTAGAAAGNIRLTGVTGMVAGDVGKKLMIRRCKNILNESTWTIAVVNSATSVDLINPQGVVADPNNGGIYWQDSFEGNFFAFTTGVNTGQRRMVRDHGLEAKGTITCVLVSSLIDNDNFFVPDGIGSGVTFEYKVTGGFVAVGGRVTIDVSALADPSAAGVALATTTAINAQLFSALKVRAFNTAGKATVEVQHTDLGTVGNVSMTEAVANAGFTVSGLSLGIGATTTTFRVNNGFNPGGTSAPAPGDAFTLDIPGATFTNVVSLFMFEGNIGLRGLKFNNAGVNLADCRAWIEGLEFAGGILTMRKSSADLANGGYHNTFSNDPSLPFGGPYGAQGSNNGAGLHMHDGGFILDAGASALGNICFRNMDAQIGNTSSTRDFVNGIALDRPDCKRTTWTIFGNSYFGLGGGGTAFTSFGRMQDQRISDASSGIINANEGSDLNIFRIELNGSGGDAIKISQNSVAVIASTVGNFNAGVGIRAVSGSEANVTTAGLTVSGTSGDMKAGLRPARLYTSLTGTAPVGNEYDAFGDGSRIATTASTAAIATSGTITISGGSSTGTASVGTQYNGKPVVVHINQAAVDATLTSLPLANIAAGTLTVTGNAAATAAVTVGYWIVGQ